jgi:hypothetical protein
MPVPTASFTIPKTRVDAFYAQHPKETQLRLGQAFYNYMELGKMTQDRDFTDALHAADSQRARDLIASITDPSN